MNHSNYSLATPLKRESVVVTVVERIRQALLDGELRPGDFLPSETELARSLGVGKSTVREAVKMLQALGVMEVQRGNGTLIRRQVAADCLNPLVFQLILQQGEVRDIYDLRATFEPAFTWMAMERATQEDIDRIRGTINRFEEAIREGRQTAEDDLAFHYAILESTRNPYIIMIGRTILQLFHASIATSMQTIPEVALRDHRRIFRAFRARDAERLDRAVLASFAGWKQSLEKR